MSYGALLALICPTFLNGATYKNKKKFLICPLFPNVLRIIIRKTKRLAIFIRNVPMGIIKTNCIGISKAVCFSLATWYYSYNLYVVRSTRNSVRRFS